MPDTDLLQIKIEKAKAQLPPGALEAINSVDWKAAIAEMVGNKGYSIEQLGDLGLETELLLAGLLSPEDYPKELQNRMGISKAQADELVKEMNEKVFKKIKDRLIENTEQKTPALTREGLGEDLSNGNNHLETREEILARIEKPEPVPAIVAQKLSGPVQIPSSQTTHSLENLSKNSPLEEYPEGEVDKSSTPSLRATPQEGNATPPAPQKYSTDPYHEPIE